MSKADEIKIRYGAILGEAKLAEKIAALTGHNRATVFRWFGSDFPRYTVVILEFMERVDKEEWPDSARFL